MICAREYEIHILMKYILKYLRVKGQGAVTHLWMVWENEREGKVWLGGRERTLGKV